MSTKKLEEIIEEYIEEYQIDVRINEERLKEVELMLPGFKCKWSGRKAINLAKLYELKRKRDNYIPDNIDKLIEKFNIAGTPLSKNGAENMLKTSKPYKELKYKIQELEVLCAFFESCEKNIQAMGFDVKNLVETIKLDEI